VAAICLDLGAEGPMRDELAVMWRHVDGTRCVLSRDYDHWELRVVQGAVVARAELFTSMKRAHAAALAWQREFWPPGPAH
jgi:hypothetical protein